MQIIFFGPAQNILGPVKVQGKSLLLKKKKKQFGTTIYFPDVLEDTLFLDI